MKLEIPELSLVAAGRRHPGPASRPSRRKHFKPTEVLSSDSLSRLGRATTKNDQSGNGRRVRRACTYIAAQAAGGADASRVIDATNVQPEDRKRLVAARARMARAARRHRARCPGDAVPVERNAARPDRQFGRTWTVRQQMQRTAALVASRLNTRGSSATCIVLRSGRGSRGRRRSSGTRLWTDKRERTRGPSTSSATSTAASGRWSRC